MNRFFTSDQHCFHNNILNLQPETRIGDSIEEMNELIVDIWNKTVKPNDRVDILGDFSFAKWDKTLNVLNRLNGKLYLTIGNHDHWINPVTSAFFQDDHKHMRIEKFDGKYIVMCHYPIARWDRMGYGSYHLHGHSHGNYTAEGRILDVGIDARPQKDMGLWHWDEIVNHMESKGLLKC